MDTTDDGTQNYDRFVVTVDSRIVEQFSTRIDLGQWGGPNYEGADRGRWGPHFKVVEANSNQLVVRQAWNVWHMFFGNYIAAWDQANFAHFTWNSVRTTLLTIAGVVVTGILAAYAFARGTFRGKEAIFLVTLGTMMLPAQVTLIPQFVLFHKLGWIDTFRPMWLPAWFGGGAFAIFLMRQFMMSLPRELDESAIIDGATYLRIFWSILLPLCKPALATLAVISVIGRWNEFLTALIYLSSEEKLTIAVGLNFFKNSPVDFSLAHGGFIILYSQLSYNCRPGGFIRICVFPDLCEKDQYSAGWR